MAAWSVWIFLRLLRFFVGSTFSAALHVGLCEAFAVMQTCSSVSCFFFLVFLLVLCTAYVSLISFCFMWMFVAYPFFPGALHGSLCRLPAHVSLSFPLSLFCSLSSCHSHTSKYALSLYLQVFHFCTCLRHLQAIPLLHELSMWAFTMQHLYASGSLCFASDHFGLSTCLF